MSAIPLLGLCIFDKDASSTKKLSRIFAKRYVGRSLSLAVQAYSDMRRARAQLLARQRGLDPWVVVTDRCGVERGKAGVVGAVVDRFSHLRPLLYSRGATDDQIVEWKGDGLIADAYRKLNVDGLVAAVDLEVERLEEEFPDVLTCYGIVKSSKEPNVPYYPRGDGTYLSAVEVYDEIVRQTAFGKKRSQVWCELHTT